MIHYTHIHNARETVDALVADALSADASDIHIEPMEKEFRVRYRIDGVLEQRATIEAIYASQIIARIKVLAHTDVAEKRLPQDGKIVMQFQKHTVDLRVATFPTLYGEKIVIRILDRARGLLTMGKLGLNQNLFTRIENIIHAHQGFFLVTGPTGAGKTTTVYALITELLSLNKNIVTLEDPIEYTLHGVMQSQIAVDIGFTFARGLRSLLRQDPDIIMIGEIRDTDTAVVALQAALTGHFVMSTLHTPDTARVPFRLIDMGIKPFLLTSLSGVLAQRLVRLLCTDCKKMRPLSKEEEYFFSIHKEPLPGALADAYGCDRCRFTGYRGRIAIFELLTMTQEAKDMFSHSFSQEILYRELKERHVSSFFQDGIAKVREGSISLNDLRASL